MEVLVAGLAVQLLGGIAAFALTHAPRLACATGAGTLEPFTQKVYKPFFARWARRFARLRVLQQGHLHLYLLYILFTVVLALAWLSLRAWWRSGG